MNEHLVASQLETISGQIATLIGQMATSTERNRKADLEIVDLKKDVKDIKEELSNWRAGWRGGIFILTGIASIIYGLVWVLDHAKNWNWFH